MRSLFESGGATLSDDRRCRYFLWRYWDRGNPEDKIVCFIGLNPSTADEYTDDPTVRRCIGFARRWGYGGIHIVNLFAYRATEWEKLLCVTDPVGAENDAEILKAANVKTIVACWGNAGRYQRRANAVLKLLAGREVSMFGLTKHNMPKHPLYLPNDACLDCLCHCPLEGVK